MTPDQLPPGVRVKALEWKGCKSDNYDVSFELIQADGVVPSFSASFLSYDGWLWLGKFDSTSAAKAACQRHHEEQVCAQLEIVVNG